MKTSLMICSPTGSPADVKPTGTLTPGIVSAVGRSENSRLQFDARANVGNTGGPLIGLDGGCLGIVGGVTLNSPGAGDVTIDGTNLASVAPDITSVRLFGGGVGDVTLTTAQILAVAPGAVGDTQIIIDSTLIAGLASADDIVVTADGQASNTFAVP